MLPRFLVQSAAGLVPATAQVKSTGFLASKNLDIRILDMRTS